MPNYTYKARDPVGKSVHGTMVADSRTDLVEKLHKMGYLTTQVGEAAPEIKVESFFDRFRGISTEDMVTFNVQFSNLIHAGITVLTSLHTMSQQIENARLREAVGEIARSVEGGEGLSEAFQAHRTIFPKLFVSMVKAGEASGKLDVILKNYAAYCEEQAELEQKIKGALFYPLLLLAAGIAVTLFIVTFIIPQFAEIFMKSGIPLPLPTQILYHVGIGIKQFWLSLVLFTLVAGLGVQYYASTARGRFQFDWLSLKLAVVGTLFRKASISRFARTLGMLVASGVPLLPSLEIVRDVVGNEVLSRAVENTRVAVEKGERIAESLRVSGEFPPDTLQMIAVGEETGNLDEMLGKISDFYDRAVQYSVKKLTTLVEPLLLIAMGALIGFIMASMLLPMFDMMKVLRTARAGF